MECEFLLTSSLEKVFPLRRPRQLEERSFSLVMKDQLALQLAFSPVNIEKTWRNRYYDLRISAEDVEVALSEVKTVNVSYPVTERYDLDYISTEPGLYPDLLVPMEKSTIKPVPGQFRSIWMAFTPTKPGKHVVRLEAAGYRLLSTGEKEFIKGDVWKYDFRLEAMDIELPELPLLHTEWFHTDCLADFYKVAPWSEEHWKIVSSFISFASHKAAVNTLLTPLFTPALDTDIGSERTCVQLLEVKVLEDGSYEFGFDLFRRWCSICKREGIRKLEISHLFTQWGAKAAPNIYAEVNGEKRRIFGWETPSDSPEYLAFLSALLPKVIAAAAECGYPKEDLIFHISDEPSEADIGIYRRNIRNIRKIVPDITIMDALSSIKFAEEDGPDIPVPATDHIEPFTSTALPLWSYYCIAQSVGVPNRFIAMESTRNRVMGVLWYLYKVQGFLHWGFNFYNSENSRRHIDPFFTTDGDSAFPAGDPFLVYPGPEGTPYSSIRNEVQMEAFRDYCYLVLLEQQIGREAVVKLVKQGSSKAFTFTDYPLDQDYFHNLRRKVVRTLISRSR